MTSIKAFKFIGRVFHLNSRLFSNQLINNRKQLLISFRSEFTNTSETKTHESIDDKDFEELTIDKYKDLIKSKETKEKIELILCEYEYEKYTTYRVPKTLTIDQMKDLLVSDPMSRKKMLLFMFRKENFKFQNKEKKQLKSEVILAKNREIYSEKNSSRTGIFDNEGNITYGLWHNTLFTRISKSAISRQLNSKLRNAALFGQKIVIDLDFDKYMKIIECRQLAKQLALLYSYNKYDTKEAFDLCFTNCNKQLETMKALPKHLSNMNSPDFYAEFHNNSYLDLFPKEKLVYLTPNAEQPLLEYNHNDIYIIGGFIDKSYHEPITYVKAKREGIRTYRLPIDEYILWGAGSKYLCLNHMLAILHDVKHNGNDWKQSLKDNIPERKQKKIQEILFEDSLREQRNKRVLRQESLIRKKNNVRKL